MSAISVQSVVSTGKKEDGLEDGMSLLEQRLIHLPSRLATGARSLREAEELSDWQDAISQLTKMQRRFIELYYFKALSKDAVKRKMNLTDDAFRLHKSKAIRKIKNFLAENTKIKAVPAYSNQTPKREYWILTMVNGKWIMV